MPAAGRVQLRRNKGWRMPANTVKVDRSTRWGNPFPIGATGPGGRYSADAAQSIAHFRDMLADDGLRAEARYPDDLTPLAGKHLACWCRPDAPCHADVLLEMLADVLKAPHGRPTSS